MKLPAKNIRVGKTDFMPVYGGLMEMKCPECGKDIKTPVKEWDLNPKFHVKLYACCGKKFREYTKK
jgi:hypothetical protein